MSVAVLSSVEPGPRAPSAGDAGRWLALAENACLREENAELAGENRRLRTENERLVGRVSELEGKLEELRRRSKRQAAPFSRDAPKASPRRPGRKPGAGYGKKAHRLAPAEVDETLEAPVPERCGCGGEIEHERITYQYQEELPEPRPIRRRVKIAIGRCRGSGAATRDDTPPRPPTRWGPPPRSWARARWRAPRS